MMLRLSSLVVRRARVPFSWGTADCAMWAFDAVHEMTGRDPAADLRGIYSDAKEAMRRLRAEGGWACVCEARIGPAVPVAEARSADVVLLGADVCTEEMAAFGALGVVMGGLVVAQGGAGLVEVPLRLAVAAWRPRV